MVEARISIECRTPTMTLSIELPADLETALREAAAREGVPPETFVVKTLRESVHLASAPCLPERDSDLLRRIGEGLPSETWRRYHELQARRRAETLTPVEQEALIALSDEIETWNARRLDLVLQLSRLRGVPLPALMNELGLTSPPFA